MPTYAMSLSLRNRRTRRGHPRDGRGDESRQAELPGIRRRRSPRPTPANSSEGLRVGLPKFAELRPGASLGFLEEGPTA